MIKHIVLIYLHKTKTLQKYKNLWCVSMTRWRIAAHNVFTCTLYMQLIMPNITIDEKSQQILWYEPVALFLSRFERFLIDTATRTLWLGSCLGPVFIHERSGWDRCES